MSDTLGNAETGQVDVHTAEPEVPVDAPVAPVEAPEVVVPVEAPKESELDKIKGDIEAEEQKVIALKKRVFEIWDLIHHDVTSSDIITAIEALLVDFK